MIILVYSDSEVNKVNSIKSLLKDITAKSRLPKKPRAETYTCLQCRV